MRKAMMLPIVVLSLGMPAVTTQANTSGGHPTIILAQAGFGFGSRDDLGPRYDPYSDRWDRYQPPYGPACRWVQVRASLADGRVVLRRQHICGFKVPARQ